VNARALVGVIVLVVVAAMTACGGDDGEPPRTTVNVFAASSLTEAFEAIAMEFEAERSDIDVRFNFAGSPTLRTQIEQGAEADVYAAADEENMQAAIDADLVQPPADVFAHNRLTIIVPADNPANVHLLPDLAKASLRLVVAAPEVPAGRYTREILDLIAQDDGFVPGYREMVLDNVVSEEPNVKAIVAKVQLGEADAGIVYVSDVTTEIDDDVDMVEIPLDYNIEAAYPAAITVDASQPEAARAFIDFLLSDGGQGILEGRGFQRAS
jgi:molybdate transport system substrate-binding protein